MRYFYPIKRNDIFNGHNIRFIQVDGEKVKLVRKDGINLSGNKVINIDSLLQLTETGYYKEVVLEEIPLMECTEL